MAKYRFTVPERYAVWQYHGKQCYLCGEPLLFWESTNDHVVSESLLEDPVQRKRVLLELGLKAEFQINGFENWLPAHIRCNQEKGVAQFRPTPLMQIRLQRLESDAPKVQKIADRFAERNQKVEGLLARLSAALEQEQVSEDRIRAVLFAVETARTGDEIKNAQAEFSAEQENVVAAALEAERVLQEIDSIQIMGNEDLAQIQSEARRYLGLQPLYRSLAEHVSTVLNAELKSRSISVVSVLARAKSIESFLHKIKRRALADPIQNITDLAGVRVICCCLADLDQVAVVIRARFVIQEERTTTAGEMAGIATARHFVVQLCETSLPTECEALRGRQCEIQVRTVLQQAAQELVHELTYRAQTGSSGGAAALLGAITTADLAFQALRDRHWD